MSKRLVLVFCALFVLACAVPAFAAVQNIKVSGDILARSISRDGFDLRDGNGVLNEDRLQTINSVIRLRVDADLTDNVQTVLRLINERDWDVSTVDTTDIDLDLAYVALKEFFCSPLSLTIGRQELHFGNDMIMGDGVGPTNRTTNYAEAPGYTGSVNGDLALRKSFDAIRATLNYDPLVIDVVMAKIDENDVTGPETTDDTDLYGVNAGYKFSDKWNTSVESYVWFRRIGSGDGNAIRQNDNTITLGGRVSTNPTGKLNLQQEIAHQMGDSVDITSGPAELQRKRDAWASQTMATVTPGWKHNPIFGMVFSYFSGNSGGADESGKHDFGWDAMYENQTSGHIINTIFPQSNCYNVNLNATLTPDFLEDVTIKGEWIYQALAQDMSAAASPFDSDYSLASGTPYTLAAGEKELGQELDLTVIYNYTEDVTFGLLAGIFMPSGNAFETHDLENATEVILSCNVGF